MKNKLIKIFMIVLLATLLVSNITLATFEIPQASPPDQEIQSAITGTSGMILTTVQIVGVAVAVVMLMVVAIKYFSAAPGEKAELKKKLVVYVVGAVILFGATGIIQIVKGFGTGLGQQ